MNGISTGSTTYLADTGLALSGFGGFAVCGEVRSISSNDKGNDSLSRRTLPFRFNLLDGAVARCSGGRLPHSVGGRLGTALPAVRHHEFFVGDEGQEA